MNIDELEAKASAATPGPWRVMDRRASPDGPGMDCSLSGPGISVNIVRCAGSVNSEADAAFIAAANPAVMLELIARLRKAEVLVSDLAKCREPFNCNDSAACNLCLADVDAEGHDETCPWLRATEFVK